MPRRGCAMWPGPAVRLGIHCLPLAASGLGVQGLGLRG